MENIFHLIYSLDYPKVLKDALPILCAECKSGQRGKCEIGKYYLDKNTIYEHQRNDSQCVQPADLTDLNENI